MSLFTIGLNHHTAPLAIREHLAFSLEAMGAALEDLFRSKVALEAAILSTCNRTEIYCRTPEPASVVAWLTQFHQLSLENIRPFLYTLNGGETIRHAFRVASGLDSMVLGEPQILGQFKQAVKTAEQAGTLGLLLHKLFQRTFSVAKVVRSQTEIGAASISMAAAAVKTAARIFPSLSEQTVLLIGAGEMIELVGTHFAAQKPQKIIIANRTLERGVKLAQQFSGNAVTLKELPTVLPLADIVVTCTASSLPILGKGLLERTIKARKHRPIFMVDLAVPRDVEAEVRDLNDVFLYTIDDLGSIIQEGLQIRQSAVIEAENIIEEHTESFLHWLNSRSAVPTIQALRQQTERIQMAELAKVKKLVANGLSVEAALELLATSLTNKYLHLPTQALNKANETERSALILALQRLHQLDDPS